MRLLLHSGEKVILVQTGLSANLAAFLDSPGGVQFNREKVALVVATAGNLADGQPEYNVCLDML